jgi:hypothetical protein
MNLLVIGATRGIGRSLVELALEAMRHSGVKQLICVTGIGAGDSKNHGGFFYDRIFNPLLLKTPLLTWGK